MQHFLVEVWVGGGNQRFHTQSVDVITTSPSEATRVVAEDLCLPAGAWDGDNPPVKLVVLPLEDVPPPAEMQADRRGGTGWLVTLRRNTTHARPHPWEWTPAGRGRTPDIRLTTAGVPEVCTASHDPCDGCRRPPDYR